MRVQLNTDKNVSGREEIADRIEQILNSELARYRDQLTRVEVHLSDVNSDKGGVDKRCVIEARPENRPPITASHSSVDMHVAIKGAAGKLLAALDSDIGRIHRNDRSSLRSPRP